MDKIEFNLGIVKDPRTEAEKEKDFKHEVLAGGIVTNWVEKTPDQWKKYIPREQDGSLSCCSQAAAKAIEIIGKNYNVQLSAHPIYRSRVNFPEGGMYQQDLGEICKNIGTTTEALDVSQWLNEEKMNRPLTVPTPIKVDKYIQFQNPTDIEAIAQAIELYKHCTLVVHCNKEEWSAMPVFKPGAPINFGHCICAVDYFLHNGVKTLLLEDSTGHFNSFDKNGQRLISEDFLKARFTGAMYLLPKVAVIPPDPVMPTIRLGSTGDAVKTLQKILNLNADGKFGPKTLAAVKIFQATHKLIPDGIVGPKTWVDLLS